MADTIKPLDILKRLYTRYYPGITIFSLLTLYGAYVVFPDENIPLLLLMFHTGQFFCWLLPVIALRRFKPKTFYRRGMVITCASLIVILFLYVVMALYLGFKPFHFISSPLSANVFILMLLMAVICSGTTILTERSLIAEKKYAEEKTGQLTSEKRLIEDQLNLLQAQIEPRFLFNTMESICSLFGTDPEKANTMQMYFIQYLRATLVKTRAKTTTIEQEMDLIRSYMNIFKVSMQEHLEYEIDVDPMAKELPFPSGEYEYTFVDSNGTPIEGVILEVRDSANNLSFEYPVDEYINEKSVISNSKRVLKFKHTGQPIEYGGICNSIGFIEWGECKGPEYKIIFKFENKEFYSIQYKVLIKLGPEVSIKKVIK